MAASEILWEATGRKFGNCEVSIRPCRNDCTSQWPQDVIWSDGVLTRGGHWGWPWPSLVGGVWLNLACGMCGGDCSCGTTSEVLLSERLQTIVSMTIDGVSIPASGYAVYDGQRLVRADGGTWPMCQDWTVTGGPGAWVINAIFGAPVPTSGELAVGALAIEIARMCSGLDCNLPQWVQRVTRQGVTMERISAQEMMDAGLTGIYLADLFINTWNPSRIQDRARAYSIDHIQARLQG